MTHKLHPVFRYADATAAMTFLERAFGFTPAAVHHSPDGSIVHAELRFGTGAIGLSSAGPVDPANVWTTVREGVYACVPDPQAHHARALAGGARIETTPRHTDYGSAEYTARDCDGRLWSFGTYAMADKNGPVSIVPELRYDDSVRAVAFLTGAFGLASGLVVRKDGGDVVHAELWLDESPLMIGGGDSGDANGVWQGRRQCTQVHVGDPDAHYARAAAHGAAIVRPPHATPYGARAYVAQDPEGFLWGFSDYVPERRG
jgi:uncharacterized glyoxalase superfamily protein PhnB